MEQQLLKMELKKQLREHLLTILTMISVLLGIITGIGCRSVALESDSDTFYPRTVLYVNFIGDIFLRILKCLILPLIISSLVAAVGSLDISLSRKIGTRAITYYMLTTVMAVILGIILVTVIRPGGDGKSNEVAGKSTMRQVTTADTMLDLIRFVNLKFSKVV